LSVDEWLILTDGKHCFLLCYSVIEIAMLFISDVCVGKAMDYGYHVSLAQIMMVGLSAEEHTCHAEQDSVALLALKTNDLNQREDRQAFLQQYHQIFSLPKKFDFQPHKDDSVSCCILYTNRTNIK